MIKLFGIVGNKASGKTTIANFIRKIGIPVIILDDIFTDLLRPGTNAHKELIKYIDDDIINNDGSINITNLGNASLNKPWIKDFMDGLIKEESSNFINVILNTFPKYKIDIAGIEFGLTDKICDVDDYLFVDSDEQIRIDRLKNKYKLSDHIIDNIIKFENYKNYDFDYYIDNNGDIDSLNDKTKRFIEEIIFDEKK